MFSLLLKHGQFGLFFITDIDTGVNYLLMNRYLDYFI